MFRAYRRTVEAQQAAPFEDAIDDGLGQIVVVEDGAPLALRVLVRGEDHGALADVAVVDHVVEDVRGVWAVREIADLIDHEHVRADVADERFTEAAVAARGGEVLDHLGGGREERLEAALDRAVRDGDREVRLASSRLAEEDDGAPLDDEVGREKRADRREAQGRLEGEVEFLDRPEEGEIRGTRGLGEARRAAMGQLLGEKHLEELVVGPVLLFGSGHELLPALPRVREVQRLE